VIPTLQLLLVYHSSGDGIERVVAYASGLPRRTHSELGQTWDFLSLRAITVRDWPSAASATEQAIRYEPSPRLLIMRGVANINVRDYAKARDSYLQAIQKSPRSSEAWLGLAGAGAYLGDSALRDTALARLSRLRPPETARRLAQRFQTEFPEVYPGTPSF